MLQQLDAEVRRDITIHLLLEYAEDVAEHINLETSSDGSTWVGQLARRASGKWLNESLPSLPYLSSRKFPVAWQVTFHRSRNSLSLRVS